MTKAMTKEELLAKSAIYFEQIEQGFEHYKFTVLRGTKVQMQQFLLMALELNKGESFVDFYFAKLNAKQQENFLKDLNYQEKKCFDALEITKQQYFYPLSKENFDFFFEITAREWLFCSYYFTTKKTTIWGNYNFNYPLFAESEETLEVYRGIAQECGLDTE